MNKIYFPWWKVDGAKLILPSLCAVILFIIALFGVALPSSEQVLIEQKKVMIAELTQTAMNILTHFDRQVQSGRLSLDEAQKSAIHQIRELRYGSEGKDYFWINDLQPKMIMHPYRSELEQQDLRHISDGNGKRIFEEIVTLIKKEGEGFVPYMWQWKDNPERITSKISFVKLFAPWNWVIGTGVYLQDVDQEIAGISKKLISLSMLIMLLVLFLSGYIIRQGLQETEKRHNAEAELLDYKNQLEVLVEKRTRELQAAQSEIKILSGFLPICSNCKKIRDDKGYWNQIESYISAHSEAEFSHSICPDCFEKLYPHIKRKKK